MYNLFKMLIHAVVFNYIRVITIGKQKKPQKKIYWHYIINYLWKLQSVTFDKTT